MSVVVITKRVPKTVTIVKQQVARPVLLAVSPSTGPIAGGTSVTLTGYGFTGATSSSLLQPGFTVVSDTTITGVTVPGAVGVVSATVSNSLYTSAPLASAFTYTAGSPPVVVSVDKSLGDAAGGTVLTIQVNNSSGAVAASACGVALTSFSIVDGTHVRGTTAAMTASATPGAITVTNGNGPGSLAGAFEAFAPTNISGGTATCIKWKDARFGITSSGGNITTHADQSGHGFDMTNAPIGHGPSSTLTTANGKPAVHYDPTRWAGAGDRLDAAPPAALTGATIVEAFLVGHGSAGNQFGIWAYGSGPNGYLTFGGPPGNNYENFGSTTRDGPSAGTFDCSGSFGYRVKASNSNHQTWIGNVAANNAGSNTLGWAASVTDGQNTVGNNVAWDENVQCIFVGGLSAGELARVQAWILDAWGVTI